MDFLGLRNLTMIRDTVEQIHLTEPEFDINRIPLDDSEVYEMLSNGDTKGVFQLESEGMTQKLTELRPERLEDLIVVISLYRPGPMKSIPVYIENKRDPSKIRYKHPLLKEILADTYGCMVYQEQVMQICRKVAGYSYGHADIVRRAMAKKKHDVMLKERESFVRGAGERGVPAESANEIFDEMVSFASYAFNKSHAAAYAYLAYQTAYLKCHYKGSYMASLMSSVMGMTGKLAEYVSSCRNSGIEVCRPDVNRSMTGFTYSEGKMYFGLLAIKNVGTGLAAGIAAERIKNGSFTGLQDFCERMNGRELNKKALENLIKAGALDGLGLNRRQMLENYESMLEVTGSAGSGVIDGQLNLLGTDDSSQLNIRIPFKPEYDTKRLLMLEKEAAGMYISGSPLSGFGYITSLFHTTNVSSAVNCIGVKDGDQIKLLCTLQEKKMHVTKKGDRMCFLTIADDTGEIDAVVFPDLYALSASKLTDERILLINGRISVKDDSVSVICGSVFTEEELPQLIGNMKLCIKTDTANMTVPPELVRLCGNYPGTTKICFYLTDARKMIVPRNSMSIEISKASFDELSALFDSSQTGLIS